MATKTMPRAAPAKEAVGRVRPRFINFFFFKVRPEWRFLPEVEKARGRQEFVGVVEGFKAQTIVRPYSTLGLREDADFLLWVITDELRTMQDLVSALYRTTLGRHLEMTYSFLALNRDSMYVKDMGHGGDFRVDPGQSTYLFVYPFIKNRDWYLLSMEARQGMMHEHIRVGQEFPKVKINTCYSFGFDDQDFVVAFETDEPHDFQTLVMKLRETEASRYTVRDTPMFTCIRRTLEETLESLG